MLRFFSAVAVVVLMFVGFTVVAEDSVYCNGSIMKVGTPMAKVKANCGEPISKEVVGEVKSGDADNGVKLYVTEWTYDKIDQYMIITFYGGNFVAARKVDKR